MMTVAILDDGVSQGAVGDLAFDLTVDAYGRVVPNMTHIPLNSHGSLCAAIVRRYAPTAAIGSINVLDEHLSAPVSHLCAALRWCANQGVPVIHLGISLMPQDAVALHNAIQEALAVGSTVVAAYRNERGLSIPAQFPGVIGVQADERLAGDAYRLRPSPHHGIQIAASSRHSVTLGIHSSILTPVVNSYAAPLISAKAANWLEKGVDPFVGLSLDGRAVSPEKSSLPASLYPDELCLYAGENLPDDIPMVYFVGNSVLANIGRVFGMQLLERGYLPLPVTEEKHYRQYGYLHADGSDATEIGLRMAGAYHADVLLAAFSGSNSGNDLTRRADILVEWDYGGDQLKITSDSNSAFCDARETNNYLLDLLLAHGKESKTTSKVIPR